MAEPTESAPAVQRSKMWWLGSILLLALAMIVAVTYYEGYKNAQFNFNNTLSKQKLEQPPPPDQGLKNVIANAAVTQNALAALTAHVAQREVMGDQTRATANKAYAMAASSVSEGHNVTRDEYNALAAKTQANSVLVKKGINAGYNVTRDEKNALSAEVQATASQTKANAVELKKLESPPTGPWYNRSK